MRYKTKYKILLFGWYGYNAIGDDIIAETIKNLFFEEADKRNIKLEFSSTSVTKDIIQRIFHSYCVKYDLIVIGGGSIIGFDTMNIYMALFGFDKLNLGKVSKNRKTPVVIFGPGFRRENEILPDKDRVHMKKIFDRSLLKGVRGPITQELLISNGIIDKIDIVGDPALNFQPIQNNSLNNEFSVGVNIRFMKGKEPQYLTNEKIYSIFANLADFFVEEGAQLYFFSFTENEYDSDTEAAKRVISLMENKENPEFIKFSNNPRELCSLISNFDFILSQRLHPCIIGWAQKVPSIGFDYQFSKTEDFMKSIGLGEFVIRTDNFSFESYIEKYEKIKRNRMEIIERSQSYIKNWKNQQREFVNKSLDVMVNNKQK